jgi:Zn-dependent protease
MSTVHEMRNGRSAVRPSPVFLGVLGACVLFGLMTWRYGAIPFTNPPGSFAAPRLALFGFVLTAWVVSLCLHEFGHAYFAYRSGDRSIPGKGYLTLNPLKYGDVILSFAMPVLFVLLGGIGLPGGAVWIDRGAIRGRLRHSLISAAGPIANVIFAVVLAIAVSNLSSAGHSYFWTGLAYLTFLQVTAALLNLLPIPGLDGFGIVEPYLPRRLVQQANEVGGYAFFGLIALLWIPAVNRAFFNGIFHLTDLLNVNQTLIGLGDYLFRFWR